MNRIEETADLVQNKGMTCAQSILTVFGPVVGLPLGQAKTLGRSLSGRSIGKFGVCGYISAAAIILGMANDAEDEFMARRKTADLVDTLCQRFKDKNGDLRCKHLLGADMSTMEGKAAIKKNNLVAKHCFVFGRDAAAILEDLL